ncbi:MAG: two-component system, OmpR family, sensor histidine kinase BaeS [Actinomycetota bacterium]|nr:two-component system, OmpR family, sensor histidine kinase BaeS [Actinomycetota bacterium]
MAEGSWRLGALGRRLLAAFLVVALTSVAVITAASLIGTARGLTASENEQRVAAAQATAIAAGEAYQSAGGWQDADLRRAGAIATAAGARLVVRDEAGQVVAAPGHEAGPESAPETPGPGTPGRNALIEPVMVEGVKVGTVRLGFGAAEEAPGQQIAWTWILASAVVAVVVAMMAAWFVSGRIATPLEVLTQAVRSFAAGRREVRAGAAATEAPGELGELARSFNATADVVSASEVARRRMASDIAHELRTPLAALQAGLEELRDGLVEPEQERLRSLHAQSVRLGRIVGDLSELAAAESSGLSLVREPVDLGELAREAVAAGSAAMEAAGLTVRCDIEDGVLVSGDPDRLHQALGNLLMNAVRHCRPGDEVTVRVRRVGAEAVLAVADTGPGIATADLPQIFERLWRGTVDSDAGGLGIGLAVVKGITAAHGGAVSADSDGVSGSTFVMRLPLTMEPM